MQLNGYINYNKSNLPGNISPADYVNVDFKYCVPVNAVPISPKVESRPTQSNYDEQTVKETDAKNFPKIKL